MEGLRTVLGSNDLMAYLVMMTRRLIEMYNLLKPTGSLFLHCDPVASHYLKLVLDAIFDPKNFRNEIIWKRTNSSKEQTGVLGKQHDIIFWYSKSDSYCYNQPTRELDDKAKRPFRHDDNDGRGPYQTVALSNTTETGGYAKMKVWEWRGVKARWIYKKDTLEKWWKDGRIYKTKNGYRKKDYLTEKKERGIIISDLWFDSDVAPIQSKEKIGYPTQKPLGLLERIIKMASNKGDLVLDPFCGCGTTIIAAQKLNREWIGIDITPLALYAIRKRLIKNFNYTPVTHGFPATIENAFELAANDPFGFEVWALSCIEGIVPNKTKGRDGGVDGRGYVLVDNSDIKNPKYEKVIVSVKGGKNLGVGMIRDLQGTMKNERAAFGVFVCIHKPTKDMEKLVAKCDLYVTKLRQTYPTVQIYNIQSYFEDVQPNLPTREDYTAIRDKLKKSNALLIKFSKR